MKKFIVTGSNIICRDGKVLGHPYKDSEDVDDINWSEAEFNKDLLDFNGDYVLGCVECETEQEAIIKIANQWWKDDYRSLLPHLSAYEVSKNKSEKELTIELVRQWVASNVVSSSDLAQIINLAYKDKPSEELEAPFDILDNLSGWCVDDELAINWGIQRMYDRFSRWENEDSAKERAINVTQQLLDYFKNKGGNKDVKDVSSGNA